MKNETFNFFKLIKLNQVSERKLLALKLVSHVGESSHAFRKLLAHGKQRSSVSCTSGLSVKPDMQADGRTGRMPPGCTLLCASRCWWSIS